MMIYVTAFRPTLWQECPKYDIVVILNEEHVRSDHAASAEELCI
jgi:hypothetical protein